MAVDPSPASTRVLFIDPHEEDREYWSQRLKMASPDYVILQASTAKAGLAICQSQRVDCVVTELELPDMTGFELLVKLVPRVAHPEVAVIFLCNTVLPSMAALAMGSGAQAYLMKSRASGDSLDMAIRKAIAKVGPRKEPSS